MPSSEPPSTSSTSWAPRYSRLKIMPATTTPLTTQAQARRSSKASQNQITTAICEWPLGRPKLSPTSWSMRSAISGRGSCQ
ncbi:hypothetical protein D3C81_1680560 [compost metagenome]